MTSREEIKQTILKVAGNPDTGVINELADEMAAAVAKLIEPEKPAKEIRVTEALERR